MLHSLHNVDTNKSGMCEIKTVINFEPLLAAAHFCLIEVHTKEECDRILKTRFKISSIEKNWRIFEKLMLYVLDMDAIGCKCSWYNGEKPCECFF